MTWPMDVFVRGVFPGSSQLCDEKGGEEEAEEQANLGEEEKNQEKS